MLRRKEVGGYVGGGGVVSVVGFTYCGRREGRRRGEGGRAKDAVVMIRMSDN